MACENDVIKSVHTVMADTDNGWSNFGPFSHRPTSPPSAPIRPIYCTCWVDIVAAAVVDPEIFSFSRRRTSTNSDSGDDDGTSGTRKHYSTWPSSRLLHAHIPCLSVHCAVIGQRTLAVRSLQKPCTSYLFSPPSLAVA